MFPVITAQGVSIALNIGKTQALKYIKKKIDYAILAGVQNRVESEINLFINGVKLRTQYYLIIALFNLIALALSFFYIELFFLKWVAFFISVGFMIYMIINSIRTFTQFINYFQNFEVHIKDLLTNELKIAKQQNWKNKLALFVNSREVHDYYLFVLDKMVNTTSLWLKNNKALLYLRVGLLFVASVFLTYSVRELI